MKHRFEALWKRLSGAGTVLLVALAGLLLMLWPSGKSAGAAAEATEEERVAALLRQIEGVGQARILLSEHGAVVVCEGASDAAARLAVSQAVRGYTGLGAHQVWIFQLEE